MSKKKNTKAKKNDVPVVIEVFGERAREAHRSAVLLGWPADYIVGKEPCNDAVFVRAPSKEAADIFVVAPSRRAAERFAAFFGDNAKITDIDPDEVV